MPGFNELQQVDCRGFAALQCGKASPFRHVVTFHFGEATPRRCGQDEHPIGAAPLGTPLACAPSYTGNLRNHAVESLIKRCFRVYEIKLRNRLGRRLKGRQLGAQFFSQPGQNLPYLARFSFVQSLQFIVRFNCLERLYKSGGARRRVAMGHAVDSRTMVGFNGNYKTIVADRYQLILDRFFRFAHQAFERARDARSQSADFVAKLGQLRAGAIVDLSVRQNLVGNACAQTAQIHRKIFN